MILSKTMYLSDIVTIRSGEVINRLPDNHSIKSTRVQLFSPENDSIPQFIEAPASIRTLTPNDLILATIPKRLYHVPKSKYSIIASTNYIIVTPSKNVNPDYLLWWFNESLAAERQKRLSEQGTSLTRLSMTPLKKFKINLPELEQQQLIGRLYIQSELICSLLVKKNRLLHKYTSGMLNQCLESVTNDD